MTMEEQSSETLRPDLLALQTQTNLNLRVMRESQDTNQQRVAAQAIIDSYATMPQDARVEIQITEEAAAKLDPRRDSPFFRKTTHNGQDTYTIIVRPPVADRSTYMGSALQLGSSDKGPDKPINFELQTVRTGGLSQEHGKVLFTKDIEDLRFVSSSQKLTDGVIIRR
jgi:hypothetical protein